MSDSLPTLASAIEGATCLAYLVAGLFFLRFWTRSRDRLFAGFAVAMWLLALNRLLVTLCRTPDSQAYLYLLRLAAFLIIIWAIVDKNRASRDRGGSRAAERPGR